LPGLRQRETRRTDEGYGLRHLGAHLLAGGETETLRRLLTLEHEGRNLWFTVQEGERQSAVFLEDVRRLWAWARTEDARAAAQGNKAPHLGTEIRCALIEASLHSLAGNIPPALLAALVEKGVWTPAQGLAYARQVPDPWQRAEALEKLAPHLPENLLAQALAAAREIRDVPVRAWALAALAPHLPPDLQPTVLAEALAAARGIRDERWRAQALAALAPHLPPDERPQVLAEALAAAREIGDADDRAEALAALAPHLPPNLLPQALAAARGIRDERWRAQALATLAPHLPPDERPQVLAEALAAAREIGDADDRAEALAALAPRLAELPRPALYPLWDKTLPVLARRTRPDLLADLQALVLVIHALGGEAAITETARAIRDVARWWP
jgi:truncated hemoglobin YjbI